MKPFGCRNMTAMEVAEALQLYIDGALLRLIAAEYGRRINTIHLLAKGAGVKRGHAFRTRGPRAYLIERMLAHYPAEMWP
jgi:hypothetical protein